MTEWKKCVAAGLACSMAAGAASAQGTTEAVETIDPLAAYQQTLQNGRFYTGESLSVADIAYSFDKHLARMDTRESARITQWHGVFQDGDVATVLYSISAMDVVFSHENTVMTESQCRHLNDGRWFCRAKIDSMKLDAVFYIEIPSEEELAARAEAASAPPTRPPLTPPRP